jgi:hypothetical protein
MKMLSSEDPDQVVDCQLFSILSTGLEILRRKTYIFPAVVTIVAVVSLFCQSRGARESFNGILASYLGLAALLSRLSTLAANQGVVGDSVGGDLGTVGLILSPVFLVLLKVFRSGFAGTNFTK